MSATEQSNDPICSDLIEALKPQVECMELMFNGLAHREGVEDDVRRIARLGARLAQAVNEDFDVAIGVVQEHYHDLSRSTTATSKAGPREHLSRN